jgi:hypothetical protein
VEDDALGEYLSASHLANKLVIAIILFDVDLGDIVVPSVLSYRQPTFSESTCNLEELATSGQLFALVLVFLAVVLLAAVRAVEGEDWTSAEI